MFYGVKFVNPFSAISISLSALNVNTLARAPSCTITEAWLAYYMYFVQHIEVTDSSSGLQLIDRSTIRGEFCLRSLGVVGDNNNIQFVDKECCYKRGTAVGGKRAEKRPPTSPTRPK